MSLEPCMGDLRAELRQRLAAQSHWIMALTEAERWRVEVVLAAIQRERPGGQHKVPVDLWSLDLEVSDGAGHVDDYGQLMLLSWPRPSLAVETVQRLLGDGGPTIALDTLRTCPILVPAGASPHGCQGARDHVGITPPPSARAVHTWGSTGRGNDAFMVPMVPNVRRPQGESGVWALV